MELRKNSNGITLVSLVVTIIVLLILAAVSINLVAGGDGILGKATTAVNETNKSKIAEEVELAMAELKADYYEARYVDRSTNTDFAEYAEDKLTTGVTTSSGGKIILSGTTISFTEKNGTTPTATGNFNVADGGVTISGITIEGAGDAPETFASQITTENYGEYVDLGTTLLPRTDGVITQKLGGETPTEQPLTDWRIFHKDTDGGIYLILADYLPYDSNLGTGLINNNSTDYPYLWRSDTDRTDLIKRLEGTANDFTEGNPWNNLIDSTYIGKGISVKGAIDLEKWVASWNARGYTELFTKYTTRTITYQNVTVEGYMVGNTNPPTTDFQSVSSDTAGYGNTLYFPHTVSLLNNYGYWLASPSVVDIGRVMGVYGNSYVTNNAYHTNSYHPCGVRPTVYIPAGIIAEKNAEGIWELDI